ncbi:MAG: type II secretion system minor pseudopilin GspI [Rickettsiales bacterium]|nr:type II secretion system minor pseudopilin GspI [Rickettsiales bacterium]
MSTKEAGFTLLEILIALTVFSIVAGGIMLASRQSLQQMQHMEAKTIAFWVAENRMAELRTARNWPGTGDRSETTSVMERNWNVRTAITQTPHPDMRKIDITVAETGSAPAASLTGFIGRY